MTESESVALPFGDSPSMTTFEYYTRVIGNMQVLFLELPIKFQKAVLRM